MEAFLDGKSLPLSRPTLACALAVGVDAARAVGRIIIEVRGDGAVLGDDTLAAPSDEAGGFGRVEMQSADPRALVRVTLGDAIDALRGLVGEQVRLAELVHTDQLQLAAGGLQDVFQTWHTVKDVVARSGALLDLELSDLDVGGEHGTVGQASNRLLVYLRGVKGSLEREDWSALADILEVNLSEEAQRWEGLLTALSEHVSRLPAQRS
ncbi:MAG: hypothetical protein U0637_11420 [Phycisphaerales bacterium]